jgi:hypothetical protein
MKKLNQKIRFNYIFIPFGYILDGNLLYIIQLTLKPYRPI